MIRLIPLVMEFVPIHINDIVNSSDDEIKFLLNGVINEYENIHV